MANYPAISLHALIYERIQKSQGWKPHPFSSLMGSSCLATLCFEIFQFSVGVSLRPPLLLGFITCNFDRKENLKISVIFVSGLNSELYLEAQEHCTIANFCEWAPNWINEFVTEIVQYVLCTGKLDLLCKVFHHNLHVP